MIAPKRAPKGWQKPNEERARCGHWTDRSGGMERDGGAALTVGVLISVKGGGPDSRRDLGAELLRQAFCVESPGAGARVLGAVQPRLPSQFVDGVLALPQERDLRRRSRKNERRGLGDSVLRSHFSKRKDATRHTRTGVGLRSRTYSGRE